MQTKFIYEAFANCLIEAQIFKPSCFPHFSGPASRWKSRVQAGTGVFPTGTVDCFLSYLTTFGQKFNSVENFIFNLTFVLHRLTINFTVVRLEHRSSALIADDELTAREKTFLFAGIRTHVLRIKFRSLKYRIRVPPDWCFNKICVQRNSRRVFRPLGFYFKGRDRLDIPAYYKFGPDGFYRNLKLAYHEYSCRVGDRCSLAGFCSLDY